MPIVSTDLPGVDLGQSTIKPRDTYAAPARLDQGMSDGHALGSALAQLGAEFEGLGKSQEAAAGKNIDLLAEQQRQGIKSDLSSGGPIQAQLGNIFNFQSPAVNARVSERVGQMAADDVANKELPALLGDKEMMTMRPDEFNTKLEALKAKAMDMAATNPSYAQGYLAKIDGYIAAARSTSVNERASRYEELQKDQFVDDALQNSDKASKGAEIQHTTADPGSIPNLKSLPVRASEGASSVDHLNATFADRLDKFVAAMPPEIRAKLSIDSAYRSTDHQQQIYQEELAKHGGNEAEARKWAAPPGHSMHNFGEAVDLGYANGGAKDPAAVAWAHENAAKFGLKFPLGNEDWHIEMDGGRRDQMKAGGHYTAVPNVDGSPSDLDPTKRVVNKIIGAESGGKADNPNPNSSANGLGQFTDGTWIESVRSFRPDLANGKSDSQLLALKTDPVIGRDVLTKFTQLNATRLTNQGIDANPTNIYLMHFAGAYDAPKIIKASDQTKVKDVMSPKSIAANPQIANMSVGEMKEWAAKKMSDPMRPNASAQNAIRSTDTVYARTSSLTNTVRRDAVVDSFTKMAVQTGDSSYLDRLPPEYMTPQIQARVESARRQADDVKFTRFEQARKMAAQGEVDRTEALTKAMDQKQIAGQQIDPAKDALNPDGTVNHKAFEYAKTQQDVNLRVDETHSKANMANLEDALTAGAATGDYSKFDPKFSASSNPSNAEVRQSIMDRDDLRSGEKQALLGNIGKFQQAGALTQSNEAKSTYDTRVDYFAKALQTSDLTGKTMASMAQVNYAGEAKKIYDIDVRNKVMAYVRDNGQLPKAQESLAIYEAAADRTTARLKEISQLVQNGDQAGIDKATVMGKDSQSTAEKVSQMPDYAVTRTADGKFVIAPRAKPQATPDPVVTAPAPVPVAEPEPTLGVPPTPHANMSLNEAHAFLDYLRKYKIGNKETQ